MKKSSLIFVLIVSTVICTFSNENENSTQTIRGTIVDAFTGYPLIGANVILNNVDELVGVITDVNGTFVLPDVPLGRQAIEISYIGYKTSTINNILVTSAKEIVLNIQLEESTIEVEEVTVKASKRKDEAINEMAQISSRTFSVEETERFAGSLGDPARMVANYAGVMTQNDSRNDIIIRGNSPMGVLWRMEDIEIPNPNHFGALGTTGGPVSMVNNNLLTNSDFLTGAFPAEYGNATAGAFDLNLRSGNNQVREFLGQIGFNGFELGAEGPLAKTKNGVNPSYIANFRYSTMEIMDALGFSFGTGTAIPEYKDLTFLVDVPGTKAGRFKIFGLWGTSFIRLGRDLNDTTDNSYSNRGQAIDFGSDLAVLGLSHTIFLNEKMRIKSTVSYQSTKATAEIDSTDLEQGIFKPSVRSEQAENRFSVSSQFRHKINAKNNYSLGFIADWYKTDYIDSIFDHDYNRFRTTADLQGKFTTLQAYAQWQHKFNDEITTYAGIHLQYADINDETAIEPRLSIKWQPNNKHSFTAGFGMHSQLQPRVIYYYETFNPADSTYSRTNEDVKFTRSNHYVIGYDYLINKDFRIKAEVYYQDLYNVPIKESFPEFSLLNAGGDFGIPREDSLLNEGTGKNYGIELTIEKFLSRGYYFLFTTSLFESKYEGYDKIERNTAYNGNYVFNLLFGYEHKLGKRGMLTFDIKTVWAGGKRYVPIDKDASRVSGEAEYDYERSYEDKYNDYFRTDLRIGYKIDGKHVWQEWAVDLQNVFNYKSIFIEGYDPKEEDTYEVYQQGFMPMVLYRIRF